MTILKVELPDEIFEDVNQVAQKLNQSSEEFMQMALSLLMQSDALDNAMIAMDRVNDGQATVALPAFEDEAPELSIELHPEALAELNLLDEEDQIDVLSDLIERVVSEGESEEEIELDSGLDLVINESEESQLLLSSFDYGDVVYQISDKIVIYLLNLPDLMPDEEGMDMDDMEEVEEE